jgi:hypothetical protein
MKLYQLPLIGNLAYYTSYLLLRLTVTSFVMRITGFQRIKYGNCIFFVPKTHKETIWGGIKFLKTHDEEMFSRLTKRKRLIFYYSQGAWQRVMNLFPIHETFIKWGPEGVAVFFVQSLFINDASPPGNPYTVNNQRRAALQAVPQRVVEWMSRRPIGREFAEAYREIY